MTKGNSTSFKKSQRPEGKMPQKKQGHKNGSKVRINSNADDCKDSAPVSAKCTPTKKPLKQRGEVPASYARKPVGVELEKQRAANAESNPETKNNLLKGVPGMYFYRGQFFIVKCRDADSSFLTVENEAGILLPHKDLLLSSKDWEAKIISGNEKVVRIKRAMWSSLTTYLADEIQSMKQAKHSPATVKGKAQATTSITPEMVLQNLVASAKTDMLLLDKGETGIYLLPSRLVIKVVDGMASVLVGNDKVKEGVRPLALHHMHSTKLVHLDVSIKNPVAQAASHQRQLALQMELWEVKRNLAISLAPQIAVTSPTIETTAGDTQTTTECVKVAKAPAAECLTMLPTKDAERLTGDMLLNMKPQSKGLYYIQVGKGRAYLLQEGCYLWLVSKTEFLPKDNFLAKVLAIHHDATYQKAKLVSVAIHTLKQLQSGEPEDFDLSTIRNANRATQRYLRMFMLNSKTSVPPPVQVAQKSNTAPSVSKYLGSPPPSLPFAVLGNIYQHTAQQQGQHVH